MVTNLVEGKTCAEVDFSMRVEVSEGCSARQRPSHSRWNHLRITGVFMDGMDEHKYPYVMI